MAAGRELQGTKSREILSQLIDRVGDLSDALDAQENSNNQIRSRREQNEDTETEIRRVFGRSSNRNSSSSTSTASAPVQSGPPPTVPQSQNSAPLYSMRMNFSNQRTNNRSRWQSVGDSRRGKRRAASSVPSGPFSRDIILLSGPKAKEVPRQSTKVTLQEKGHIINAFQFRKEWTGIDVELGIRNALQYTLPIDVDLEILYSVHTSLSKPTLAPGQELNGATLSRVFHSNKPIYVRPSKELVPLPPRNVSCSREILQL